MANTTLSPKALPAFAAAAMLVSCAVPAGPTADCPSAYHADPARAGHCLLDDPTPVEATPPELPEGCEDRPLPAPTWGTFCTSVYEGDLVLLTDEAIVAFCDSYDCVAGGVMVGGAESSTMDGGPPGNTITSMEPLSCLVASRFLLMTDLRNIDTIELPSLRYTQGGFSFVKNPDVTRVSAPLLTHIGGDLSVQLNDGLSALELPALQSVGEFFLVVNNPRLPPSEPWGIRDELCPGGVGAATTIARNGAVAP